MKVIRRLEKPTPGLVTYLDCVGDDTDWDEFRFHGSGASYRELRAALTDNQRGLCAYCGWRDGVGSRFRPRQVRC